MSFYTIRTSEWAGWRHCENRVTWHGRYERTYCFDKQIFPSTKRSSFLLKKTCVIPRFYAVHLTAGGRGVTLRKENVRCALLAGISRWVVLRHAIICLRKFPVKAALLGDAFVVKNQHDEKSTSSNGLLQILLHLHQTKNCSTTWFWLLKMIYFNLLLRNVFASGTMLFLISFYVCQNGCAGFGGHISVTIRPFGVTWSAPCDFNKTLRVSLDLKASFEDKSKEICEKSEKIDTVHAGILFWFYEISNNNN